MEANNRAESWLGYSEGDKLAKEWAGGDPRRSGTWTTQRLVRDGACYGPVGALGPATGSDEKGLAADIEVEPFEGVWVWGSLGFSRGAAVNDGAAPIAPL